MSVSVWLILNLLACQGAPDESPERTYTVVRGDTLFLIAKRHGTTVDALRSVNALEGDLIDVDQVLVLPSGHTSAPPKQPRRTTQRSPSKPMSNAGRLTMPRPEPCLTGPSGVDEEHGMAASEGVSLETARRVLNSHVLQTLSCFDDYPDVGRGTATLDLHVACSGVVSHVDLAEMEDWPKPIGECIAQKMRYADFPPHALPDGDVVRYPLTYTPPTP